MDYGEEILFPKKSNSQTLSLFDIICYFVSAAIGTGITKLGSAFNSGWLTSIVINTCFAVTTWMAINLQFKAFAKTRYGSLEACTFSINKRIAATLLCIGSTIPSITCLYFYLRFCQISIKPIILWIYPSINPIAVHEYTIALVLMVIFLPISCILHISSVKFVSRLKFALIFVMCIFVFILCKETIDKYGFDPNNEMRAVKKDINSVKTCISAFTQAYLIQPISFPSIGNLSNPTKKRVNLSIIISMGIAWLMYNIFGLLEYFSLFEKNIGGVFFNYFPNENIIAFLSKILLTFVMILSIVVLMNPVKNVLIFTLVPFTKMRSQAIWIWISLILYIFLAAITQLSMMIDNVITFICDVFAPIVIFIYPVVLYIIVCWKESIFNNICAIIICIFGSSLVIFYFYIDYQLLTQ